MTAIADLPEAPPPELWYRRRVHLITSLRELWRAKETIRTLTERDLRVRYKQAILGVAWVIVTPVLLMIVFNLFFKRIARVDTGDVPYPLFTYVALLPWSFFSSSIGAGTTSLINNSALLNKLYCPREVFPLGNISVAAVDGVVSTSVLGVLFVVYGYAPRLESLWVPVLLLILFAFTTGVTLLLSACCVYVRDLRSLVPMFLQLGLFATPIAWEVERIPKEWRSTAAAFNPLIAVMDGIRGAVLYGRAPSLELVVPAAISSVLVLVGGYYVFKRLETGFADIA